MGFQARLLRRIENAVSGMKFPGQPAELYAPIRYSLSNGGKRIRPLLVLLANALYGGKVFRAMPAALAVELFHNFTLIHDDIMDRATLRRGKPTVCSRYGTDTAILAGDAMLVCAYRIMSSVTGSRAATLMHIFNEAALRVCEGQQMDLQYSSLPAGKTVTARQYVRMTELKTAALIGASLQIGAFAGGASARKAGMLQRAGIKLGIAFQVQDDLLDAFGEEKQFGKKVGGDIMQNKQTYLLVKAMEAAKGRQKAELLFLMRNRVRNKVVRVKKIFDLCGVRRVAERLRDRYLDEAFRLLDKAGPDRKRLQQLERLAFALVHRER